jgi:hypothetical protein
MQTWEMLERGGCLHEDSGVYERQNRSEVGLGKGEFLSHRWRGMVMEEEPVVER